MKATAHSQPLLLRRIPPHMRRMDGQLGVLSGFVKMLVATETVSVGGQSVILQLQGVFLNSYRVISKALKENERENC